MPTSPNPARTTLVRLSRTMARLTSAGMAAMVVLMGSAFLVPTWTREMLLARLGQAGANLPLGHEQVLAAAAITAVPFSVMLWGLWNARAMFNDLAGGHAFSSDAARHLHRFGVAVLAQALLGPLTATALALALSLANPPGQRILLLTLSSNDYIALVVGGVLIALASVMREAARLAEENASFV